MTFLTYGFAGVIRAEGNPKTAMNINIAGALINIILDPLFIIVFKMGVAGAAIATLISNLAAALLVIYHFTYSKKSSLNQIFLLYLPKLLLNYHMNTAYTPYYI